MDSVKRGTPASASVVYEGIAVDPPGTERTEPIPEALGRLAEDQRLILPGLLAAGLVPRLWDLGRLGFWLDELNSLSLAGLPLQELMFALTVEANMTLYYWLLFGWLRVVSFNAPEVIIRLPSVVFGAAAVPLIYLLGRRIHSPRVGLAAGALLAVNPFHVLMSQEARSYTLLACLTIVSYLLLDRALTGGRRRAWLLHGLVTALAFYSHFYTLFTILAQGVSVLSRRSRAAVGGLVVSGLVMFLLLAQLIPFFSRKTDGANLSHIVRPDLADVINFFVSYAGGSQQALAIYAALAIPGVLLIRSATRPAGYVRWLLASWYLVPVVLVFAVSLSVRPIVTDRYLFATLPALTLMAALGIVRLPRPAGLTLLVLLLGLCVWTLRGDFEIRRNEQWREAVEYATASAQPGDGWILISKWGQTAFEYYAGWYWGRNPAAPYADVLEPFDWRQAASVPKYRGLLSMDGLEPFSALHRRVWMVLSHEYDTVSGGDLAAPVRDWLTRHGYAASQRQFRGVRVLLYERRRPA